MIYSRLTTQPIRRGLPPRTGFTLVELLVVLTLMVSLAGMLSYALASAQNDARIKRTQADVLTIGQLLQSRVNEVSLAPVDLAYSNPQNSANSLAGMESAGNPNTVQARERSRLILAARRDLIRLVMPECRADLLFPPATLQYRYRVGGQWIVAAAKVKPPAQWNRMRTLAGLYSGGEIDARVPGGNPVSDPATDALSLAYNNGFQQFFNQFHTPGNGATSPDLIEDSQGKEWTRENESAECLYLILATTNIFGGKAIDQIPSSSIGDTDGDGFLEILDAWGNPYEFIRNPSGLNNPAIKNFNPGGANLAEQYPSDPDPLDFLLADFRYEAGNFSGSPASSIPFQPFYLPPVIISAGRDGEFGIRRTINSAPDFYSASNVVVSANTPMPNLPNRAYRYPDPFIDVSAVPAGNAYPFVMTNIQTARQGGGLGGLLNRETAADNITSLDAGL